MALIMRGKEQFDRILAEMRAEGRLPPLETYDQRELEARWNTPTPTTPAAIVVTPQSEAARRAANQRAIDEAVEEAVAARDAEWRERLDQAAMEAACRRAIIGGGEGSTTVPATATTPPINLGLNIELVPGTLKRTVQRDGQGRIKEIIDEPADA